VIPRAPCVFTITYCIFKVEIDPHSESHRRLLHPFHIDQDFLFEASEEELNKAGLLGDGNSLSLFVRLCHTYHLACRRV
jgi:hypothetical protein